MSVHPFPSPSTPAPQSLQKVLDHLESTANLISADYGPYADLGAIHDAAADVRDLMAEVQAYDLDAARKAAEVKALDQRAKVEAEEYGREKARRLARRRADEEEAEDDDEAASWTREDLTAFLDDDDEDFLPTVLEREDGAALFYTGLNMLYGDSGSGKSMVMAATVAQQLAAGQIVAWIDYEEVTPKTLIKRLRKLGVPREVIDAGLWWKHSDEALTKRRLAKMAAEALEMAGEERTVGLLVIDSVGEALGAEGLNEDKDSDTGPWMNRVRTVLPLLPDAAVVVVDHSTKAKDGPGRLHPSGSKRKRAALTGVAWLTETVEEFSKQTAGAVQLVCAKDRHGNFRRGDVGALVRVTPNAPAASESGQGGLEIRICAPQVGLAASTAMWPVMVEVHQVIKKNPGASMNGIEKALSGHGNEAKREARNLLVQLGAVDQKKKGNGHQHTVTRELTHADSESVKGLS